MKDMQPEGYEELFGMVSAFLSDFPYAHDSALQSHSVDLAQMLLDEARSLQQSIHEIPMAYHKPQNSTNGYYTDIHQMAHVLDTRVVDFMVRLQRVQRHFANDSALALTNDSSTIGAETSASFGLLYDDARMLVDNVMRQIGYAKAHTDFNALNDADNLLKESPVQYQLQDWINQLPYEESVDSPLYNSTALNATAYNATDSPEYNTTTSNGAPPSSIFRFYGLWVDTKVFEYEIQAHAQRLVEYYGVDNVNASTIVNLVAETSVTLDESIKGLNPKLESSFTELSNAKTLFESEIMKFEQEWLQLISQIPV
jgi:hypothetical protein